MRSDTEQRIFDEMVRWSLQRFVSRVLPGVIVLNAKGETMSDLSCYGCDTGIARHHQDGARSWIECECGKLKGPAIDMSDANHIEEALAGWERQASEALGVKEEAEETPISDGVDGGEQTEPVDDTEQGSDEDATPDLSGLKQDIIPDSEGGRTSAVYGHVNSPVDQNANFDQTLPDGVSAEDVDPLSDEVGEAVLADVAETPQDQSPDAPLDGTEDRDQSGSVV